MKVYDPVLKKDIVVQEFVTGDEGREIKLDDPKNFKKIFDCFDEEVDDNDN